MNLEEIKKLMDEIDAHKAEVTKPGTIVRHFKRDLCGAMPDPNQYLYKVVGVCQHTETGESLVCYRALYGDHRLYARPLTMFISQVDREKYPEAKQRWRLEKYEPKEKVSTVYGTPNLKKGC